MVETSHRQLAAGGPPEVPQERKWKIKPPAVPPRFFLLFFSSLFLLCL
jgi:hypothetical protein